MPQLKSLTKAYSGISKEMWILAIAMLINRCGSMVLLFMSVYLTQKMNFSISKAGLVLSMFGLGSLLGAFVGGKLVDRYGFYPILWSSLILSGIMLLILGQMEHYIWIAIFTFMVTATGDMFRPANMASINSYSHKEGYTQAIALNRLAMNLGFTIGPILGGFLAFYSYHFLFWADGITCITAASFLLLKLPKREQVRVDKKSIPTHITLSPYKDANYLYFLFFTMLYALAFFQLLTTLPLFYKNEYQLSEKYIGWLMALNGIGVAVMEMFLLYYIRNKWTQFKFIALGCLLLIVAYLILMPVHSIPILIINILLLTFSEMVAMPFMSTYMMHRSEGKNMGDYSALYSMSWSTALILAPVFGTQIIDHFGYAYLWVGLAAIGTIAFAGFRWLELRSVEESKRSV